MAEMGDLTAFASDASFSIDGHHAIVGWNDSAQQLLGYELDETVGRQCSNILQFVYLDGELLCRENCECWQCFERNQPFSASFCRARHKNGDWIPLRISSVVLPKDAKRSQNDSVVAVIFLNEQELAQDLSLQDKLQIFSFGNFSLTFRGRVVPIRNWQRKQSITLLKYLASHLGQPVHREVLIEQFWPNIDESLGQKRLKVLVYFLRRQLYATGMQEEVLETVGKSYLLNDEMIWLDALAFQKRVAEGSSLQGQQRWHEALTCYDEAMCLYKGDYMANDVYADWCTVERDQFHESYLEMLAGMVDCYAACSRDSDAVRVCRIALVCDPIQERFHRLLMEYLVRLGRSDSAVAQYRTCQSILAKELGVDPLPETQLLYQQIVAETSPNI
jgi:PAS domain S-box-containing protein